ncbi:MAG: hypothetical protein OEN01_01700 [Candidatus Krumholzibacteria bacterium]|nr:hypothetical protein [Candidatus Krumholzibacteria bacterium]
MLPAMLLVGLGDRRRFWLPLPTLLLWPIWLLGWVVWLVLWMLRIPWRRPLRAALEVGHCLSGFRVDVNTAAGGRIHLRMI